MSVSSTQRCTKGVPVWELPCFLKDSVILLDLIVWMALTWFQTICDSFSKIRLFKLFQYSDVCWLELHWGCCCRQFGGEGRNEQKGSTCSASASCIYVGNSVPSVHLVLPSVIPGIPLNAVHFCCKHSFFDFGDINYNHVLFRNILWLICIGNCHFGLCWVDFVSWIQCTAILIQQLITWVSDDTK